MVCLPSPAHHPLSGDQEKRDTLTPINPLFSLIIHPILLQHQPLPLPAQLVCLLPVATLKGRLGTGETRVRLVPDLARAGTEGEVVGVGLVDLVLVLIRGGGIRSGVVGRDEYRQNAILGRT